MSKSTHEHLFSRLISLKNKINKSADVLSKGQIKAFKRIFIKVPHFIFPLHGFYTTISWLYILYFEAGKITFEFLAERAYNLGLDPDHSLKNHKNIIYFFRTYLQHNLNPENRDDFLKQQYCVKWIDENVDFPKFKKKNALPEKEEDWQNLLDKLLSESINAMQIMLKTIVLISKDEYPDDTIKVWTRRIKRNHPPHEYDELISVVAADMGVKFIQPSKLRGRYIDSWNKKLSILQADYQFSVEARKLIEQTLMDEEKIPLPITGDDVINELGIPSGHQIKKVLSLAQTIFRDNPCNRETLLSELKKSL